MTEARVVNADCVEYMKASVATESVDLVFADPPFNIGFEYADYEDNKSYEEYMAWSYRWMNEVWRILKPNGTFWLAIGDAYSSELDVLARRQVDFYKRSNVIWHYSFGVNCLRRSTPFITDCGVKTFNDFIDGDIVTVKTPQGNWKQATVRCYGDDTVYPSTFVRKGGINQVVWATRNHRWLKNDNTFVETHQLNVGDILKTSKEQEDYDFFTSEPDERLWWCYGFVYGDGSVHYDDYGNPKHSSVRLCGRKNEFLNRFAEMGFRTTSPQSIRGDNICYTGKYFKEAPNISKEPLRLIRAFVRGYLDADGARAPENTNLLFRSITTSDDDAASFIRTTLPCAGFYITTDRPITPKGYANAKDGWTFNISNHIAYNTPYRYVGTDWGKGQKESVWCLEVEDDEAFVLPNGIVTGNCKKKFTPSHTHLFHYVKDLKEFTFNAENIKVQSARASIYNDKRAKSGGRLPDDVWVLRPQAIPEGFQPESDTWFVPRVCGTHKERVKWHTCQMPEAVLERIIKVSSNPGNMVLDPFAGSASTGVVSKRLGRHFLGIEMSKEYAEKGQARLVA